MNPNLPVKFRLKLQRILPILLMNDSDGARTACSRTSRQLYEMSMDQALEILDHEAEQIVADIGIPPCPGILTKLMQEMRNDEPDFVKLGKLISGDISLAAAMLKTVNSPFYGLPAKAKSVQAAISLLGLRNVAQLVSGLVLRDAFPGGSSDLMGEYWESTSAIAQISALLAQEFKCINSDEAYTFALFRDCGMLAMMSNLKSYRPVLPGSKLPAAGNVTASEDRLFGVNHARVGCQLAKNWLLPDEICQAILRHHRYSSPKNGGDGPSIMSDQRVALVLAAEAAFVTHKMGILSEEWRKGAEFALAVLDITQADLDRVTGDLSPALLAGR